MNKKKKSNETPTSTGAWLGRHSDRPDRPGNDDGIHDEAQAPSDPAPSPTHGRGTVSTMLATVRTSNAATDDVAQRPAPSIEARSPDASARAVTNDDALSDTHVSYLTARAVPAEFAIAAGLRSVGGAEGARLLGWGSPAALRRTRDPVPQRRAPYHRLRLDEPIAGARFFTEKGREVPVYVTDLAATTTGEIYVVEGPIKALALAARGLAAVGLGGTGTTLTKKGTLRVLNNSWECLGLDGRRITIVFDAGRRTNPNVARDEARLAMTLEQAGAHVRVADLPTNGGGDQGPDDYLASHGLDALKAVLAAARSADPVEYVREVIGDGPDRADRAASLLDDLAFRIAVSERGDATTQTCARSIAWRSRLGESVGRGFRSRAPCSERSEPRAERERSEPREHHLRDPRRAPVCHPREPRR